MTMDAHDLLMRVCAQGAVIWGTGFVARLLHEALEREGLWCQVRACVVSTPEPDASFFGVPVLSPYDLAALDGTPVELVAVHEAVLEELRPTLDVFCADQWVWAYPLLPALLFGPVLEERRVPVRRLIEAQGQEYFWLAVRLAAVHDATQGRSAYLKAQALHCTPQTAARRYDQLVALARSVEEHGFDEAHPLLVDESLRVIDGLHRLVLAHEQGFYDVPCRVVARSEVYDRVLDERNRLPLTLLEQAGLTSGELAAVRRAQERLFASEPLVSIVMPAYNVEGYLDQCMETVVGQTMPDFEAILVDDGSTDGTYAAAQAWAARDERVRVLHQPNGGVSLARNAGMDAARGTWLAFVDPDDWLEPDYLEALLAEAARTGADRVECDLWRFDGRTGRETRRSCGGRMGVPYTREEQMRFGPTASYKALTRRAVWERNAVRFPDCPYESPAVYALVVALARKLAYVPRPLYHYRRFRPNSLVETAYAANGGSQAKPLGVEAMEALVAGFERCGLRERYDDVLQGIVTYRLSDMLAMYHHRMEPAAFDELVGSYRALVARLFGAQAAAPYLMLGGYNLNRMLLNLDLLQDPRLRLNFSSVIALTDEPLVRAVSHPNRYRELMLQRELGRELWTLLAREQPTYLFWDLMEERHDVGVLDGRLVTLSDAFAGSSLAALPEERIARNSARCQELWEQAADAFVERVAAISPATRIVVVADQLAERVGNLSKTRAHEDVAHIRRTNAVLDGYYAYLAAHHPQLALVDVRALPAYFTDEHHEYGVVPEHLNAFVNQQMARLVGEVLAHE